MNTRRHPDPPPRAATLNDVARLAGVSQSAVSRTFTPGASVAPHTRQKVLEAARKLGYRPNAMARALMTRRSRIVAVVVSYLQNQFYPVVIKELSQRLQRHGYHVLLFVSDGHEEGRPEVDDVLLDVMQYQIDGVVLASATLSSSVARGFHAVGVPIVLFNRLAPVEGASAVVSDNYAGGRMAARVLLDQGCRRIAYVAGLEDASTHRDRERGLLDELADAGRPLYGRAVGHYNFQAAARAARQLFQAGPGPDGIFAANDHMAFAVLDTVRRELGKAVPDEVAVVGFDNVPQAEWGAYDLTTVEQDAAGMAAAAVELLLERMEAGRSGQAREIVVPVRLLERGTTRRSPGKAVQR